MDIEEPLATQLPPFSNRNRPKMAGEVMFSSGGRMVGRGLNFLSQLMLARALGPEVFGIFAIGWNILRLLVLIGPLGLEQAVIRYGSKFWKQSASEMRGLLLSSSLMSLFNGILLGLVLALFSTQIAGGVFKKPDLVPVFHWLSLILPLSILLHLLASATTVSQKMKYLIALEEIAQPLLQIAIWVILLILGKADLEGAMLSTFLSYLVPTVLALAVVVRIFPEIRHTRSSYHFLNLDLFLFTIPTSLAVLFGSLISWGDRLIVGYFRSAEEAGIYQALSLVSIIFVVLLSGIKGVVGPVVARLFAEANLDRIKEIYAIFTRWGVYVGLGLFALILVTGRELLALGFGSEYAEGYIPLVILAFAQVINIGTGPLDTILIMIGHQKAWLDITLQTLLVSLVLGVLLTWKFGLVGTAISTSITVTLTFVLGFIRLYRAIPVNPYNRASALAVVGAAFAAGAGWAFKLAFPQLNIWLSVFLTAGIILAIYGLYVWKFLAAAEEKQKILEAVASFLKPVELFRQRKPAPGERTGE